MAVHAGARVREQIESIRSGLSIAGMARRVCACAAVAATATLLGCITPPPPPAKLRPPAPPPRLSRYQPAHPLSGEERGFLRLGNLPAGRLPVRVGALLPFTNGSAATRQLAENMMKAAGMALFESGRRDIVLMTADEGAGGADAATGARRLISQGAEIIIGPLFAQSVTAVAPIAADHGIPVVAFSTDRAVARDGVYLLSFQPENQVRRIVFYAAAEGHTGFAALLPRTAYGTRVAQAFRDSVQAAHGRIADLETFVPDASALGGPVQKVSAANADAILIAQGGPLLRDLASTLASDGAGGQRAQYLGTGLWDDPDTTGSPDLAGALFAAPDPDAEHTFEAKYRSVYGASPQPLAALAYDAVSLVSLLSSGPAYRRFTSQALTNPDGFSGVDGMFRFLPGGTCERGLAVLRIQPGGGVTVVSPAPRTFQNPGT